MAVSPSPPSAGLSRGCKSQPRRGQHRKSPGLPEPERQGRAEVRRILSRESWRRKRLREGHPGISQHRALLPVGSRRARDEQPRSTWSGTRTGDRRGFGLV